MTRVLIVFHVKSNDQLEIVYEWPAKRENHEGFLLCEFSVIAMVATFIDITNRIL